MKLGYFAPLEGITGALYRNAHHLVFGGVDAYFMPFFSPNQNHCFSARDKKNILPENNAGTPVVPQVLCRDAQDFLWAAGELKAMGYAQVNLNLGCPSGTVAGKGKGAGALRDVPALDAFLAEIYAHTPLPVSIKTRIGIVEEGEMEALLAVYKKYPVQELILHPRLLKDVYRHPARVEAYARALPGLPFPVCYNGDLVNVGQCAALLDRCPQTHALMIGRGLVADPALLRKRKGGAGASRQELTDFHALLYEGICRDFGDRRNAMLRMKEYWLYHIALYGESEKLGKKILKTHEVSEYERLTAEVLAQCPILAQVETPLQASMK